MATAAPSTPSALLSHALLAILPQDKADELQAKLQDVTPLQWLGAAVGVFVGWTVLGWTLHEAKQRRLTRGMPGSSGLPLLGNTVAYAVDPRGFQKKLFAQYGPYVRGRIMGVDTVFVKDTELSTSIFVGEGTISMPRNFSSMTQLLGTDFLLLKSGKEHAKARKPLVAVLSQQRVIENMNLIGTAFNQCVNEWHSQGPVPLREVIFDAVATVMLQIIFGRDLPKEVRDDILNENRLLGNGFLAVPVDLGPFNTFGRAIRARARLNDKICRMINERRADANRGKRIDFISKLIEAVEADVESPQETKSMADNTVVLIFGALDTTVSVFTSIFDELQQHPAVLKRVLDECKSWMTKLEDAWDFDLVSQNSTYIQAVFTEVMRMHAPFVQLFRRAKGEVAVNETGYVIPDDWLVVANFDTTFQDDEKNFPNAKVFNPDRFMPDGASYKHVAMITSSALTPFGMGPHICPGRKFAEYEIRVLICILAWRARFDPAKWPKNVVKDVKKWVDVPARLPEGVWTVQF